MSEIERFFLKILCLFIPTSEKRKYFRRRYFLRKKLRSCNCISYSPGIDDLVKKGTVFPHPVGMVIGEQVTMGKNCILFQNITLGFKKDGQPTLEDNAKILAGAIVVGKVTVGENSIVGAGSVLLQNPNYG